MLESRRTLDSSLSAYALIRLLAGAWQERAALVYDPFEVLALIAKAKIAAE
jgi:hypothetical protein